MASFQYILCAVSTMISGATIAFILYLFLEKFFSKKDLDFKNMTQEELAIVDDEIKLNQELKICSECLNTKKLADAEEHYAAVKQLYEKLPKRLKKEFFNDVQKTFKELLEQDPTKEDLKKMGIAEEDMGEKGKDKNKDNEEKKSDKDEKKSEKEDKKVKKDNSPEKKDEKEKTDKTEDKQIKK